MQQAGAVCVYGGDFTLPKMVKPMDLTLRLHSLPSSSTLYHSSIIQSALVSPLSPQAYRIYGHKLVWWLMHQKV